MAVTVHVGDTGTVIEKTLKDSGTVIDVSAATTLNLNIKNADGTLKTLTGSFKTDGTDGIVQFTSAADTWTVKGASQEQVELVLPTGTWRFQIETRTVGDKLD